MPTTTKISAKVASERYGVSASHNLMLNGEARFRLTGIEGGGYIRTVGGDDGAWQIAHYHEAIQETYIVQSGWMAFCDMVDNKIRVRVIRSGGMVTSEPLQPHNVFLPSRAVIHTVKFGDRLESDWIRHDSLNQITQNMNEVEIVRLDTENQKIGEVDENTKIKVLMDHYVNLDRLIWSVPTFFASGATILIGFFASISTKNENVNVSHVLLSAVFIFAGFLFFLSFYSIHKMSFHHKLAGDEIGEMGKFKYFAIRNERLARRPWHSAHVVFKSFFAALSILSFSMGVAEIIYPDRLNSEIFRSQRPRDTPPPTTQPIDPHPHPRSNPPQK